MSYQNRDNLKKSKAPFSIDTVGKAPIGAYFNLARYNFYRTIVDIYNKVGFAVNFDEEKFAKALFALYRVTIGKKNEMPQNQKDLVNGIKLTTDKQEKLKRLLYKHFPFIDPILAGEVNRPKSKKSNVANDEEQMAGVTLSQVLKVVANMALTVHDCRNYYTHYNPYNSEEDQMYQYWRQGLVAHYLERLFTAARRISKNRERLTSVEMEFLTSLNHYFKQRNEKTGKFDIPVERDDYYFKITGKRQVVDAAGHDVEVEDEEGNPITFNKALSDFGVLYLCILFLNKTYARKLIDEMHLLDGKRVQIGKAIRNKETGRWETFDIYEGCPYCTDKEKKIISEILSVYRIRVPHGKRIDCNDRGMQLAMDILNELRKCPMPLYDLLTPEGRRTFEDEVQARSGQVDDKGDPIYVPTGDVVKRLRHDDRFAHLVLKYIDEKQLFSRIRFQVRLGAYRFKFYDKTCVDGETRLRRLQKDVNGYGRLQEIEALKQEEYKDMLQQTQDVDTVLEDRETTLNLEQFVEDDINSQPYLTDSRAVYNIHNNRIGMLWNDERNKGAMKPNNGNPYFLPNFADGKQGVVQPGPLASLSIYDFPAMVLYDILRRPLEKNPDFPTTEQVIIDKHDALRRFFNDVYSEDIFDRDTAGRVVLFANEQALSQRIGERYGLQLNEIPDKLKDQLVKTRKPQESGHQRMLRLVRADLSDRISQVERKLERYRDTLRAVGSADNKYGKKQYVDVRHGTLARRLAGSLARWMPRGADGKTRLTGLNFNVLTSTLATFGSGTSYQEFYEMLEQAGLLSGDHAHPFLRRVLERGVRNIEDLYEKYMVVEIEHLNNVLKNNNLQSLPFVHPQRARWSDRNYKQLAHTYLHLTDDRDATMLLPDGLFAPWLKRIMQFLFADNQDVMDALSNDQACNSASYLINAYMVYVQEDEAQPFYYGSEQQPDAIFNRAYDLFTILQNRRTRERSYVPAYLPEGEIMDRLKEKTTDGKRKIMADIEARASKLDKTDLAPYKKPKNGLSPRQQAREAMITKLKRCYKECQNTERTIRRYMTQDIILFQIAREILSEMINFGDPRDSSFKLFNIFEPNFLSHGVRVEFKVEVFQGKNKPPRVVTIYHDNMALKNYGEISRLVNDERTLSLLQQLKDVNQVEYTDLCGEFDFYDNRRTAVFKIVQEIEQLAYERNRLTLNDVNHPAFYVDGDSSNQAVRTNFKALLDLLSQEVTTLSADDRDVLRQVRNAFSHNSYNVALEKLGPNAQIQLPRVAKLIIDHITTIQSSIPQE